MKIKAYQFNVISRFCEDLAKGLMLAIILGQAVNATSSLSERLIGIIVSALESLLLLSLAVYFSKETK